VPNGTPGELSADPNLGVSRVSDTESLRHKTAGQDGVTGYKGVSRVMVENVVDSCAPTLAAYEQHQPAGLELQRRIGELGKEAAAKFADRCGAATVKKGQLREASCDGR